MKQASLFQKDILTSQQFTFEDIDLILRTTKTMRDIAQKDGCTDTLRGKIMTALFFEPSSRTFGSFIAAMQRLGGGFIPLQGVMYSSVAKGETLADTVSTFANYSDVIVIRHPHVGSAAIAADASPVPIINAGDGPGEHPTQALLDLFTIVDHFGTLDSKTITLAGDLLYGRTVHSLVTLLAHYKKLTVHLISPKDLSMPRDIVHQMIEKGISVHETYTMKDVISETDVLYMTRVQKERFRDMAVYESLKHHYLITPEIMKLLKKDAILMHPFPRVGEIETSVDDDPRALYLTKQMQNGMYVRMALLSLVLKG